jgi:hypothetical protein
MRKFSWIIVSSLLFSACAEKQQSHQQDQIIGRGQMPAIANANDNGIHIVYGTGDSIMYSFSTDQGKRFSAASLIAILPDLAASHTRGPQIASTKNGIVVLACNEAGDIFSYCKQSSGGWLPGSKVNDVDTTAKENLMALSADEQYAYAIWLDLRGNKQNKIYGAKSDDGGKSWTKNTMVYTSPDTTVCECCKPSVVVKGNNVYVLFRNWLKGNRDMFLIQSKDGGKSFGEAQQLGTGNWALDGCPMDGGGIAIQPDGIVQTIWRREDKLYTAIPGSPEQQIGEGKSGTVETMNGRNVYAWTEKGELVVTTSGGQRQLLGKGQHPLLKSVSNDQLVCVWENDHQIHTALINN